MSNLNKFHWSWTWLSMIAKKMLKILRANRSRVKMSHFIKYLQHRFHLCQKARGGYTCLGRNNYEECGDANG